jgi:tripartite-type tricarboxylate transporter receptor subunit TctC
MIGSRGNFSPNRKEFIMRFRLSLVMLTVLIGLSGSLAVAQEYPVRPIRLIVPFAPGGGTDLVGRVIAPKLSERLGKPVVVDNRGGAGAILGTTIAAQANPDGYTLLIVDTAHTIQPALQKLEYDPIKSFSLIAKLANGDSVFAVPPSVPANTVKEFIALAKQKPGQLVAGTAGLGSSGHMALELFRVMADIDIIMAHYKGAGAALIDLLGGYIHISYQTIAQMQSHIKSGKLKALGTGGVKRSALLPDVPTLAEAGLPGYQSVGWRGIVGPAGIPAPIIDRLSREIKAIVTSEEVKMRFLKDGMEVDHKDPVEFAAYITEEINRWSQVVKKANIKVEGKQ